MNKHEKIRKQEQKQENRETPFFLFLKIERHISYKGTPTKNVHFTLQEEAYNRFHASELPT